MSVNLGRVAYVEKGAYDSGITYEKKDVVFFNGGSYVFIGDAPAAGKQPTDAEYWQPMVLPVGGGEGTGEDGGYYIPAVNDAGLLTWSASKTGMQEIASANIKGPKGDTPVKGMDYFDGEDGESVTVKSVSESTEDGGSNVVTFSDGKTLTVKNGSKGSKGDTPVKGTDYWTASDKSAMVADTKAALPTLTLTGVDADGVTHTYTIYGS